MENNLVFSTYQTHDKYYMTGTFDKMYRYEDTEAFV